MITTVFQDNRVYTFNSATLKFTTSKVEYSKEGTANIDFQKMFLEVVEELIERSQKEFENGFDWEIDPQDGQKAAALDSRGNLICLLVRKDKIGDPAYKKQFEVTGAIPHYEAGGKKGMADFMWSELAVIARRP